MEAVKQPSTTPTKPLPAAEPCATGFINRTAQTFFSKVEERRYAAGQNFFYFTPTLLPLFGILYGGAPEDVKQDLKKFLHDDDGSCDVHEAFGNWLKVPQEVEAVEQKHARAFFSTSILWVIGKIRSLGMWLFPKYFPPPAPVIPTSWKTETDTGILIAHRETATIPEKTRAALSHYCEDPVTFATNGEATERSNAWISERTQGAIQDLVPDMEDPIQLLLLAAASFKGNWVYPFDESKTSPEKFTNSDGSMSSKVDTMQLKMNDLRMTHDQINGKSVRILELPMHGNLAMYVVIDSNRGADVKEYLASEDFLGILNQVDEEESPFEEIMGLLVKLPKFELKDRVDILSELSGDPLIQKIQQARWDGSLVETSDSRPSKITQMVSQTNLSLDETGVKIKAASYTCCAGHSCPPTFYANKPFGLVLFDKKTKTILGMGQINKLSDSKSPLFRFFLSS
ncbi:MAG: hypothetical protein KDK96_05420 [Chlamydiia bacterium]|nr:hypothetical protein [Chlamydiia bacterium]